MKKLLGLILIILIGCKKDISIPQTTNTITTINQPVKVGFIIDSGWFSRNYDGYSIQTHNGRGEGDFNNDGKKDLVVMFASNSEAKYLFQKDTSSRIVIGVFINHKTYFELDTNLVYSYLGGYDDISVSDINKDGYLDVYQATGPWENIQYPIPNYYNNSGWGAMDSYVFMNDRNVGFKRYILPSGKDDGPSAISMISDNNKNGLGEIYLQSCSCYFEFNGTSFIRNELVVENAFKNQTYSHRVLTPKFQSEKYGIIYTSEIEFGETYFILKVEGNRIIPKVKFKPTYPQSGPGQNIYVEDLDKDGKLEYVVPMGTAGNNDNTKPGVPYLMVVDELGNDVSSKYLDVELTKPLTYEQIDWIGEKWQTGFIYYTFTDIDNDGINEIFPASGIGHKKENDTYYYKFVDGKYRLKFYHSNWIGNVHKSKEYINYEPFVDEKNGVNLFLVIEFDLRKSILKTF